MSVFDVRPGVVFLKIPGTSMTEMILFWPANLKMENAVRERRLPVTVRVREAHHLMNLFQSADSIMKCRREL